MSMLFPSVNGAEHVGNYVMVSTPAQKVLGYEIYDSYQNWQMMRYGEGIWARFGTTRSVWVCSRFPMAPIVLTNVLR